MINIRSNGSKWCGDQPDSIAKLVEVLNGEYVLDRTFEQYGNFVYQSDDAKWNASGNFLTLSNGFNIEADTREELADIEAAIDRQRQRPDYLAQPGAETAKKLRQLEWLERMIRRGEQSGTCEHGDMAGEASQLRAELDAKKAA